MPTDTTPMKTLILLILLFSTNTYALSECESFFHSTDSLLKNSIKTAFNGRGVNEYWKSVPRDMKIWVSENCKKDSLNNPLFLKDLKKACEKSCREKMNTGTRSKYLKRCNRGCGVYTKLGPLVENLNARVQQAEKSCNCSDAPTGTME